MEGPFHGEKNTANQAHNREIEGITETVLGTFLFPPGMHGYRVKFTGGVDGDVIKAVEDATPVDAIAIDTITMGSPTIIKTKTDHNLQTTNIALLRGIYEGSVPINNEQVVTVIGPDTFSIPVDTSAATGTYSGGKAIDLVQAKAWLATSATVDPDIDVQYRKFTQRANTDNDGFSDYVMFDTKTEGVRRVDFQALQAGTYKAELETV